MLLRSFLLFILIGLFLPCPQAPAAEPQDRQAVINGLVSDNRNTIMACIEALPDLMDYNALNALSALREKRLGRDDQGRAVMLDPQNQSAIYADNGQPFNGDRKILKMPVLNNRLRKVLKAVIADMSLFADDSRIRLKAAQELSRRPQRDSADRLRKALAQEKQVAVREALALALALIDINSAQKQTRLNAIAELGRSGNNRHLNVLKPLLVKNSEGQFNELDADVRRAAQSAIDRIETHMVRVRSILDLFYGVSLGSVLLLAALGLAITFGLMGVINMAHGEMLMLGAYATYVTQNFFKTYLPAALNWYLPAAIPVAFGAACLAGIILERCVIRFLYGRPLETLLATWGISLLLIQTVRLIFGAQNVQVINPAWLSGAVQPVAGLVLTYNRLAIIGFVVIAVALVYVLLNYTSLGLKVRCVTQNRAMAASMGIHTSRVDMWTFGIGSGIAGLGGVALSQIGNVGPELGQGYIVDSFMVVVLGGVGKIAGTIWGAMGLGIINKLIEPHTGAVLGKICLLVFIILFIQKRPQGLFAQKGRA
jgi:urea transport system permease protein